MPGKYIRTRLLPIQLNACSISMREVTASPERSEALVAAFNGAFWLWYQLTRDSDNLVTEMLTEVNGLIP
jgi:hypothetical protein